MDTLSATVLHAVDADPRNTDSAHVCRLDFLHLNSQMTTSVNKTVLPPQAALSYAKPSGYTRSILVRMARGLWLGLLAAGFSAQQASAADGAAQLSNADQQVSAYEGTVAPSAMEAQALVVRHRPKRANFEQTRVSQEARHVADWVVDSGDNRSMPFLIVARQRPKFFVFDASGQLRGAAAALLGLALGDDSVPGIGQRKLSTIRPEERTTPAGRFVASLDRNLHGEEILWVDYDTAISLHRVITTNAKERRVQRLDSPSPLDHRISYGCINVPVKFYNNVVSPAFTGTDGIVYVLPETRSAREVFGSYDVEEYVRQQSASQAVPASVVSHSAK